MLRGPSGFRMPRLRRSRPHQRRARPRQPPLVRGAPHPLSLLLRLRSARPEAPHEEGRHRVDARGTNPYLIYI